MGSCWCKVKVDESEMYSPDGDPCEVDILSTAGDGRFRQYKNIDSSIVDQLVIEMLSLIASFIDNDDDSPVPLVKLHLIADKEDGWLLVVTSMVKVIPLDNPLGPSAITIVFDDCPLPSRDTIKKLTQLFRLSRERALCETLDLKMKRNMCIVLGCIAEKLAGPNSVAILNNDALDFLLAFMTTNADPCTVLFALIAIEKFAHTTENKMVIRRRFDQEPVFPLLTLETLAYSDNYQWRQVGFCAQWALDNLFIIENRPLSYETVDMTNINVVLNSKDVSEYLKISCNGLEARCDSYSFESVRCTFLANSDCWYYEVTIITSGVMQIGWATKNSHFLNHEGFGIGDDLYSLSYDGCRRLVWYKAKPVPVPDMPEWKPGDILGCLIDFNTREVIFSLNGQRLPPCTEIFESVRCSEEGFFAAASFMAFQQCRFNFGHIPFRFPPTDRPYYVFNDYGYLTADEKKIVPRRIQIAQIINAAVPENPCTICYDAVATIILEPCFHKGFCVNCSAQLHECPLCRASILNVARDI